MPVLNSPTKMRVSITQSERSKSRPPVRDGSLDAPAAHEDVGRHRHPVARVGRRSSSPAAMKRSVSSAWCACSCSSTIGVGRRRRSARASRPRASSAVANAAGTRKLTCSPSTAAGDVDADDVAFLVERRAAAHAAAERAAEEDLRIEAAPHHAVVGALRRPRSRRRADCRASRCARPAPAARSSGRKASASKRAPARVGRLEQRQVVQHVDLQDLQRRLAAVGGDVDQVVALGLQRRLG